jgi:hypothetical protein
MGYSPWPARAGEFASCRDLTIRCKIENGRYYCAFGRSKAHHESGHHVVLILLSLCIRADVFRRHQPRVVTERLQLAALGDARQHESVLRANMDIARCAAGAIRLARRSPARHQIAPQIAPAVDLDEAGQGHGGKPGGERDAAERYREPSLFTVLERSHRRDS